MLSARVWLQQLSLECVAPVSDADPDAILGVLFGAIEPDNNDTDLGVVKSGARLMGSQQ